MQKPSEQIRRLFSFLVVFRIYLLVRFIVAVGQEHAHTRALTPQHPKPQLNWIVFAPSDLLFGAWYFGVRTYYAYAFHLPPPPPPPHHIQCDKFCEQPQNQKSIIGMHSCRARLYLPAFCRVVINGKLKCSKMYARHSITVNCFRVIHIISNRTFL